MDEVIEKLMTAIGAMAEAGHAFYKAMIKSGADRAEATAGMQSFVAQFLHETMENSRQKKRRKEQDE